MVTLVGKPSKISRFQKTSDTQHLQRAQQTCWKQPETSLNPPQKKKKTQNLGTFFCLMHGKKFQNISSPQMVVVSLMVMYNPMVLIP